MEKKSVIIVDDHELYRLGIRHTISKHLPEISILTECKTGKDLLLYMEKGMIPDIVILDIIMPDMNGIEVAKVLRDKFPDIKIIMLSSEISQEVVWQLLNINVNAYLSKIAVQNDLENAIQAVLSDNFFYGKDIAKIMYDIHINQTTPPPKKERKKNLEKKLSLSKREIEILTSLYNGKTIIEIAKEHSISPRTVSNHKASIMKKLGFKNNLDLIKYAIAEGIVVL